ncbi:MAG: hypothetical protein J7M19_02270 [Planctomycetes bacterium]|nr:hypothetical protein [Planctomycetota bacterium]
MDFIFKLIPLFFVLIIIIIQILVKLKQMDKGQSSSTGQKWTSLADTEELRKFLRQVSQPGSPAGPRQAQAPRETGPGPHGGVRPIARGPVGLPAGRVTPTAPRAHHIPGPRKAAAPPPRPRHIRQQPPARPTVRRFVPDSTAADMTIEESIRTHGIDAEPPEVETSVERREHAPRRQVSRLAANHNAVEKATDAAGQATVKAEKAAEEAGRTSGKASSQSAFTAKIGVTMPQLDRERLRQAIVMAEVLGVPLALRDPGA